VLGKDSAVEETRRPARQRPVVTPQANQVAVQRDSIAIGGSLAPVQLAPPKRLDVRRIGNALIGRHRTDAGRPPQRQLAVPVLARDVRVHVLHGDAAVLRDTENQPFLYLQTGATQFSRRLVTLGESSNGRTQITSGLKEGERVVGDGSLFLQFQNSMQH